MKVLVLSHMYPSTFNNIQGIFVQEQVKALKSFGVVVEVVSPKPWTPFPTNHLREKWKAYDEIPGQETRENIKVHYPRYLTFPRKFLFNTSGIRMYWGIDKLFKQIKFELDFELIHAHVALPDGDAASRLAKELEVPFVITIHGQNAYRSVDKNRFCKEKIIKVFRNSAKVFAVSNRLKEVLTEKLGSRYTEKIEVVENGININNVVTREEVSEKVRSHIDENKITILTVGYLIERKGHRYVLEALAKYGERVNKGFEYLIGGDGPRRDELEELTREKGLEDKVTFLGQLSHEEVMEYMLESDIFVLPSWDEAFGVVYLEAMVHGTPVIGCRGEGVGDFVEDGKTGLLVEAKNVDEVANALKFLVKNPKEARRLGRKARKLVLENYTWGKNAEKTSEVYREVLSES